MSRKTKKMDQLPPSPQIDVSKKKKVLLEQQQKQDNRPTRESSNRHHRLSRNHSENLKLARTLQHPPQQHPCIPTHQHSNKMNSHTNQPTLYEHQASTIPSSSVPDKHQPQPQEDKEDETNKNHMIMFRLAMRNYHLPGNNVYQDFCQYIRNNHPLFGIFLYHKLHPIRWGQRIVFLLGSVAFGLIVTSFTTLYFVYIQKDINTALVCVSLSAKDNQNTTTSSVTGINATDPCQWKITWGMITLWTLGGVVHTLFDQSLWFMSACCCCLPGALCGNFHKLRKVGSYAVLCIVAIFIAIATFGVILRAKYEARKAQLLAGISTKWQDPESFSFVVGFIVLQLLSWFVYYFILASIMFSGILVCGTLPIIGGRPYEMWEERKQDEEEGKRKQQELHTITTATTMSSDGNDIRPTTTRMTYIRTNSNEQDIELFYDLEAPSSSSSSSSDGHTIDSKSAPITRTNKADIDIDPRKNKSRQDFLHSKRHKEEKESNCDVAITRKYSF